MNPSKGNTSSSSRRSPSSSPQRPPSPTNEPQPVVDVSDPSMTQNYGVGGFNFGGEGGEQPFLKTPEEVLADLTTSENSGGSPPTPPPEGQSGDSMGMMGGSMAIAVGGAGGVVLGDIGPGAVGDIGAVKKRKASDVKDPPTGIPTCPVCKKTFSSWKGAFGHMRKHPERHYRGFFKPPTFSSSSSNPAAGGSSQAAGEGGSGSGGQGRRGESAPSSPVRGVLFDLNRPMEGADDPAEEGNVDEGNKVGFDLNEFPADEDKP